MTIAERMKEIREYRGLKQFTVANAMGVSQQAYSLFENKSGNQKVETLKRFCRVVNVDLSFLVASEIPITDANIKLFDSSGYAFVVEDYKKLKSKLDTYEELILKVGSPVTQN
jgi:transcriptional regulator with XRE-family HTH domain